MISLVRAVRSDEIRGPGGKYSVAGLRGETIIIKIGGGPRKDIIKTARLRNAILTVATAMY